MDAPPREVWHERFTDYLAHRGMRLTRQRELIAEQFFASHGHPDIEDLYRRVRALDRHVGQATVYRTLKLLVDSGLANVSRFGERISRYEAQDGEHHHDHLICTSCGKIIEFTCEAIEHYQEEVAESHSFEMTHHKMELYGRCSDCRP
jgi:Fur family ferric uptake transcriptional regulator